MWPNPQESADLVTFTEGILNGKHHFLYNERISDIFMEYRNGTLGLMGLSIILL